ncbi:MAG: dihydroorotate dehydrogenase electron transfer subunit [bacterium]|nr:dihydroorotate dehydrogenase electron transfer subunit [bacterium]
MWDNNPMKDEMCTVEENKHINETYYMLKIKAPYIAENAKPGNFVMLKASVGFEPLLKRPFGIFDAAPPFISFYYQVVGKGTELIASLKSGDEVQMLGPLGNSFPQLEDKNILLVAGGRGLAPLYYAAKNYLPQNKVFLIYGARSAQDLNLVEELQALPFQKLFLYTDDGSAYEKGFVTTHIRRIITGYNIHATISCGPDAMFESLAREINTMKVENYVSMEALMGCGFGICCSCAVKMAAGDYKKACSDGPIFKMEEVAW